MIKNKLNKLDNIVIYFCRQTNPPEKLQAKLHFKFISKLKQFGQSERIKDRIQASVGFLMDSVL